MAPLPATRSNDREQGVARRVSDTVSGGEESFRYTYIRTYVPWDERTYVWRERGMEEERRYQHLEHTK